MAEAKNLIDKKFGKLTVTRKAEKDGRYICWYCDCDCGTKDFVARGSNLNNGYVTSCGCAEEKKKKPKPRKPREKKHEAIRMTDKEKEDWDKLYRYVLINIMGYDENQSLSNNMSLRLKGLLKNKFVYNRSQKDTANYTYEVILNTFKFCYLDIEKGFRNNSFNDEQHKFNYALKIVEDNINTVYMRMKNIQKEKEKALNSDVQMSFEMNSNYKRKTEKTHSRLNDLW